METGISTTPAPPTGIAKYVPLLSWAKTYDKAFLRGDVIAGVSVAALIIPKNLGYAEIAGVPIEHGLYAAAAGAILYGIFGTSRQISTGPSSGIAAVAGSAVVAASIDDPANAISLVSAIAILTGLIFLVMSLLKLGWIARFISRAVITGFLFGAALDVIAGELPKITGSAADGDNAWREFWSWLQGIDGYHSTTLAIGATALAVLFGLRVVAPQVPGALVVVAGGLLVSAMFNLGDRGVSLVGDVPRGFPALTVPDLDLVSDHASLITLASVAIVLIGFSQSTGDARHFAARHRYQVDIDQESFAQGAANFGAGLVQGIPVSTSLSASSLNDRSGARSQFATIATGAVVVLTLLVLAPVFSELPKAILGAVVIEAVWSGMVDVPEMRRLFNVKRSDFWIALAAIAGVVLGGVLTGVVIGVILSVVWLVKVVTTPSMPILGRVPGTHVFNEIEGDGEGEQFPGITILRMDGALFYVTADALDERIREIVRTATPRPELVILTCPSVTFIDSQGAGKIGEIGTFLAQNGIDFRLARIRPQVAAVLASDGIIDAIGVSNLHLDVNEAIAAHGALTAAANQGHQANGHSSSSEEETSLTNELLS